MSSYDVDMTGVDLVGGNFMATIRNRAIAKAKAADPNKLNLNLRTDSPVMTQVDPNALKKPAGGGKLFLYGGLALGGVYLALKMFKKKK